MSGAETFEEWEVVAQAAISGSGMSLEEQSGLLFNKLERDAKREIIGRGGPTVLTPDQLVLALGEVFTKIGLVPRLLSKFRARDQLTGESLAAYSHARMELMDRIAKADPSEVPEDVERLLKKFCAGVTDPNLRWELTQQLKAQPQSSFIELRETAFRWDEEYAPREETRQVVKSAAAVATDQTLNVMLAMKDYIASVSDKLTKQQDTLDLEAAVIDALQKMLPSGNEMYENGQSSVHQMTHGGSNVVCYYCQKVDTYREIARSEGCCDMFSWTLLRVRHFRWTFLPFLSFPL